MPADSQQLWAQDPAPVRRCGTEGRTWHQGREGDIYDGGGDGNEDEYGNEHEGRDGVRTEAGMNVEMRVEGRERERESLGTYEVVIGGGWEDARGGATPTITIFI